MAWAAAKPTGTCPIIGARDLHRLQPPLNAVDVDLTAKLNFGITA